ncbi:MAG: hypothetical protein ACI33P_15520 [Lysinibacillus sp.]
MTLLTKESPLIILPSVALKIGTFEAVFLQQLHYRLNYSNTVVEGYKWYQCTMDKWLVQLSILSKSTVERIIKSLCAKQLVERKGFDGKGTYYRIRYEVLQEMLVVDSASNRGVPQTDGNHASTCGTIVPQTEGAGTSDWGAKLPENPDASTAGGALRSKERIIKETKDVLLYTKANGGHWSVEEGLVFQAIYEKLKEGTDVIKLLKHIRKACQQQIPLNPQELFGDGYA